MAVGDALTLALFRVHTPPLSRACRRHHRCRPLRGRRRLPVQIRPTLALSTTSWAAPSFPSLTFQPRRIRPDPGSRGAREDRMRSGGACGGVGAGWRLDEAGDGEAAAAARGN